MSTPIALALNTVDLLKHALYKGYQFPREIEFLNRTQERILMTLKYSDDLTMVTIAQAIGLEKGPFSQTVDKLEHLKLLHRRRSDTDKRNVYLKLTPEGESLAKIVEDSMERHFEKSLQKLTMQEQTVFFKALHVIKGTVNIINSK